MRLKPLLLVIPAMFATAALANQYSQPWAIVESGDISEPKKDARVGITKVDGKSTRNARKSDPIEPGKHTITVAYETARAAAGGSYKDLEIDLEGCTRYRIVARYETKMDPKWEPHVYAEPISECVAKFKKKPAEAPKK